MKRTHEKAAELEIEPAPADAEEPYLTGADMGLTPEEEDELEDRYQAVLRGEYIDGDEFLARWERRGRS